MPFPTPTIRIRLTGLLAFFFTKDTANPPNYTHCRIGIHDTDLLKQHQFRISQFRGPDKVADTLVREFVNKVEGQGITLTVTDPDARVPGIIVCPQSTGPFSTPDPTNELGFNLIPDIEGTDFHDVALPHHYNNFIHVDNGVFYTKRAKPAWILRAPVTTPARPATTLFKPQMGIEAGINIYLKDPATSPNSKAVLTYFTNSLGAVETLELTQQAGIVHELDMLNDCPIGVTEDEGMFESDFKNYYSQLSSPVPSQDQFHVFFFNGGSGHLSFDHPCGPIFGGRSS